MLFADQKVAAVFAEYQKRAESEDKRMRELGPKAMDVVDEWLLPVGVDVGRFLHSLILATKPKRILELGTSYGYSTLLLADAAREVGASVITMDIADYKQDYALAMMKKAGLSDCVDFRLGDAPALIDADCGSFDLVLLDIWKDMYVPCFKAFYPKLSDEAIIAADNMIEPAGARESARLYRAAVKATADLHSTLLPIGNGVELSVKWNPKSTKL